MPTANLVLDDVMRMPRAMSLTMTVVAAILVASCATPADSGTAAGQGSTDGPSLTAQPTSVPAEASGSQSPSTRATDPVPSSRAWTSDELALLAGARADVAASCRPLEEEDLPPGAAAGVGCDVRSDLVEGVGFYQFDSLDVLMDVYEARLAEYGIPLATDVPDIGQAPRDCWRGFESESMYAPGGSADLPMNREGCFINEHGFANLRYVWGGPLVYIGVLGNNGDVAALKAWSWYDEAGNEPDSPGGPGLWQPEQ